MARPQADPSSPPQMHAAGQATVLIHADARTLAVSAARQAAEILRDSVSARGFAHAMFATGNSQLALIERLVTLPGVPWDRTAVFHMDEYIGAGARHPAGFQHWIRTRIAERVHPAAAYYIDGEADPVSECDRYSELLREFPLDLCCLGIGENGHLAFNDPPVARFDDPLRVKVVELTLECRLQQVGEGHFPNLEDVPTHAITVTIPALLAARRVLAIVPERRKAAPVHAALSGPVTTECPASILRRCDHATVHLDHDSASALNWT